MNLDKSAKCQTFYKPGKYYAITINPNDRHQYFCKPNRMTQFRTNIYDTMMPLSSYHIQYRLYIELSETKARLHCHGWLYFKTNKSIKDYLLYFLHSLQKENVVKTDLITNLQIWKKYILKQQLIMQERPISNIELIHTNVYPCEDQGFPDLECSNEGQNSDSVKKTEVSGASKLSPSFKYKNKMAEPCELKKK